MCHSWAQFPIHDVSHLVIYSSLTKVAGFGLRCFSFHLSSNLRMLELNNCGLGKVLHAGYEHDRGHA